MQRSPEELLKMAKKEGEDQPARFLSLCFPVGPSSQESPILSPYLTIQMTACRPFAGCNECKPVGVVSWHSVRDHLNDTKY